MKEVISENEHLHEAQKNRLISRMFHTTGSETDELDDLGDSTGLDSDNKVITTHGDFSRYIKLDAVDQRLFTLTIPQETQDTCEINGTKPMSSCTINEWFCYYETKSFWLPAHGIAIIGTYIK